MPEPIVKIFSMYIIAPEPISTAHFINPSHQSVCLYMHPPNVVRQRQKIHAAIEELLDASFPIWSVLYQTRVCGPVYLQI
jgi:hypothetical protein